MPFISKDWRSPGEAWVKTEEGWEKMKVLECSGHRYRFPAISTCNSSDPSLQRTWGGEDEEEAGSRPPAPHCHVTIKCTREIAGFNGLSEAVRRLDFWSAVRDVRRFNYICALLQLLLGERRLASLPGAAQKLLLSMLEEVANQVASSQQHTGALRRLAAAAEGLRCAERAACWGRPLGSRALWGFHHHAIDRVQTIAREVTEREPAEHTPQMQELPEECVREIMLRIADHRDLEAMSSAWSVMSSLCGETRVWRQLCRAHFTRAQLDQACAAARPDAPTDWKQVYHTLRKAHGLREDVQYAETLSLCRHCECLFWRSLGHPCIADQCPEYRERLKEAGGPLPPHPVPPAAFLKFFSL